MRYSNRCPVSGKFTKAKQIRIGSLYSFKGSVVRVKKKLNNSLFFVSCHKSLFGLARPQELSLITKKEVADYLDASPKVS